MAILDRVKLLLVSGVGTGLLPGAPGTWGSAAAAGLWLLAAWGLGRQPHWLAGATGAGVLAAGGICVWLAPWAVKRSGQADPPFVVIDEWAGQWLALLVASSWPAGCVALPMVRAAALAAVAFVAFRAVDILKPWPCRQLEKLPGGWGILADDLAAGTYAGVAAMIAVSLWHPACPIFVGGP